MFKETLDLIINILTFLGIIFGAYFILRNPQIKAEKFDSLIGERFKNHEKSQSMEFKYRDEAITQLRLSIQNIKDNDLHTIEGKIEDVRSRLNSMELQITRTNIILEERLPKKTNQ